MIRTVARRRSFPIRAIARAVDPALNRDALDEVEYEFTNRAFSSRARPSGIYDGSSTGVMGDGFWNDVAPWDDTGVWVD